MYLHIFFISLQEKCRAHELNKNITTHSGCVLYVYIYIIVKKKRTKSVVCMHGGKKLLKVTCKEYSFNCRVDSLMLFRSYYCNSQATWNCICVYNWCANHHNIEFVLPFTKWRCLAFFFFFLLFVRALARQEIEKSVFPTRRVKLIRFQEEREGDETCSGFVIKHICTRTRN